MFRRFFFGLDDDIELNVDEGSVLVRTNTSDTISDEYKNLRNELKRTIGLTDNQSFNARLKNRELNGKTNCFASLIHPFLPSNKNLVYSGEHQIFCGSFTKDGSEFISASQDRYVRVFDSRNWKIKERIRALEFGWSILDFDSSETHIAYGTWSSNICFHTKGESDVTQRLLPLLDDDGYQSGIFSLSFSPDEKYILAGGHTRLIFIYDLEAEHSTPILAHDNDVNAVKWLGSTSNLMLSGSDDGMIKLWDKRDSRRCQYSFIGNLDGITNIDCMENGIYFLSNSKDQSIRLWDIRKNTDPMDAIPPPESYWDYRYGDSSLGNNGRELRSGKYAHKLDNSIHSFRGHCVGRTLIRAKFSPMNTTGQRYIYCGSAQLPFSVYIYDIITGKLEKRLDGHNGLIRDLSWNPNYPQIVSVGWDGDIIAWDC